ncbi:MAG: DNA-protecting protein DprA [Erysipelotrichaceae bacterium]|nr:DNA-protecting protein DprA [Erysipelotrichaceae bacterium]
MRNKIAAYAQKYQGDWSKIAKAISSDEHADSIDVNGTFVTIVDAEYPDCFRKLRFPPWIIYYEGDLSLLNQPSLAIVGSRELCLYASKVIERLVGANIEKVIVSGLAKGADAKAHQCAKRTIGVLGCGLDVAYPKENSLLIQYMKTHQLVISEYPCGTLPMKHHFPWRNRLIAALSDHVVAVQAKIKSGTSTTIMHANELSKPVYCVPYSINDSQGEGCNYFIAQGAQILLSADEKF